MKRIDIYYGGEHYSVGGRRLEDLRQEVEVGLMGGTHWLEVNDGEGMMRTAYLMITPGVPLAIVPIPETPEEIGDPSADGVWSNGGPPVLG
ncbi:hypothetical protein [Microbacterium kyungheense]|uniref:Uncharacterized protein n=1 Tax=Microbacterium kyungheense TaxID=1263636 RepID=A0A543FLP5_9MICO|nr:hypothetical protein [Microbacterium kyungheense]TQM34626.1 hypothetical protein FB391_0915 [Microbacterium kyungheense]